MSCSDFAIGAPLTVLMTSPMAMPAASAGDPPKTPSTATCPCFSFNCTPSHGALSSASSCRANASKASSTNFIRLLYVAVGAEPVDRFLDGGTQRSLRQGQLFFRLAVVEVHRPQSRDDGF